MLQCDTTSLCCRCRCCRTVVSRLYNPRLRHTLCCFLAAEPSAVVLCDSVLNQPPRLRPLPPFSSSSMFSFDLFTFYSRAPATLQHQRPHQGARRPHPQVGRPVSREPCPPHITSHRITSLIVFFSNQICVCVKVLLCANEAWPLIGPSGRPGGTKAPS